MHSVGIRVVRTLKLYLLILELFLYKLFCVHSSKFWQLDLLLLDDESWKSPLSLFFIPLGLFLDFVYLLIRHKVTDHLIQEIKLFGLFSDRVQQLLVFLSILLMYILELIGYSFVFLSQLFDDFPAVFNLFLQRVVALFFLKQLSLLALFFLQESSLFLLLLFQVELKLSLFLGCLTFFFFEDVTTDNHSLLHLLEDPLQFGSFVGLFLELLICLLDDLLLLLLLLQKPLS